jgi:hypothetical protein
MVSGWRSDNRARVSGRGEFRGTRFVSSVSDSGTNALTLTLNRKSAFEEKAPLVLTCDANAGNVKHAGAEITLESFSNQEVTLDGFIQEKSGRPAVTKVEIDVKRSGTASTDEAKVIRVTFNKEVTATNVGFNASGSAVAEFIVPGAIGGSGTNTL